MISKPQIQRILPVALVLMALACATPARAAGHPWWKPAWRFRRAVTVENPEWTKIDGADLALVTMPTGGKMNKDGRDVRVATSGGKEVPCRVLMTGPGDRVRLAFETRPKVKHYYVYFGNPDANAPEEPLEIRRGVLMETWAYQKGPANNLRQARRTMADHKGKLLGRDLVDRVFVGHNPFGPQAAVMTRFTGWLLCPADGEYTFACSSSNASFVLIDGKEVIDNGGWHRAQRDIRKQGKITLKRGLHKVTFLHVSPWGYPTAVLAWKPPGHKDVKLIPPGAYAPFQRGEAGAMARRGSATGIDYLPEHAGEAFVANRYYQRYVFRASSSGLEGRKITYAWDFGDGQTATGEQVEHVYLVPGMYRVTLTVKGPRRELTRSNRIFVTRPWERVTSNKLDGLRDYGKIVATYRLDRLPARACGEAILVFDRLKAPDHVIQAGRAMLGRDEKIPGALLRAAMPMVTDSLLAKDKSSAAASALLKAAELSSTPDVSARLTVDAGRILLRRMNKTDDALTTFQVVLKKYASLTTDPAIREARIGIGDVWRAGGDYDKAAAAYEKAGVDLGDSGKKPEVLRGDLARHVEAYLKDRKYADAATYLEKWRLAFPADLLDGYWSWMAARVYLAQEQYVNAVREAEVLVRVNPRSNYGAKLLMIAHRGQLLLRNEKAARETLRRVVEEYPETEEADQASAKLKRGW